MLDDGKTVGAVAHDMDPTETADVEHLPLQSPFAKKPQRRGRSGWSVFSACRFPVESGWRRGTSLPISNHAGAAHCNDRDTIEAAPALRRSLSALHTCRAVSAALTATTTLQPGRAST